MYLVTASQMQAMDRETIQSFGIPGRVLMEAAGRGATGFMLKNFADLQSQSVAVLAGRGNNGGDGYVMARCLSHRGIDVTVYLLADRRRIGGDAAANLELLADLKIPVVEVPDQPAFASVKDRLKQHDVFIDAILGTGLKSDVRGYLKDVIVFVNDLNKPIFAVDMPSGLNSDTGQVCGVCIRAKATATFGLAKVGQFMYPGARLCGRLDVVDIGIPPHIIEGVGPDHYLLTRNWARTMLRPRLAEAHKGSTGHLLVIAGSAGKTGAAAMTSMSAVRAGAGLVTLAMGAGLNPVLEVLALEAMTAPLPEMGNGVLGEPALKPVRELLEGKGCLAIGPGIGQALPTRHLVLRLVSESAVPMVIDADGLNNLATDPGILKSSRAPLVLTPHPGEMARLTGTSAKAVQKDRVGTARTFALEYGVHVVLKGANTVIAHPDGSVYVNTTGNAGMASGGMGDVLTGVIAGLICQGNSLETASRLGAYLHGAAADTLQSRIGPFGYLASEVMDQIPKEIALVLNGSGT